MDFIISLAHFCEIHGPTSILCTQVLPISCLTCYPPESNRQSNHQQSTQLPPHPSPLPPPPRPAPDADYFNRASSPRRISSEPHSRKPSFSRRNHDLPASVRSALHDQHVQQLHRHGASVDVSAANLPSPLESPRSPMEQQQGYSTSLGSIEAASRYGGAGGVSTDTCPNCSLSIPQSLSEKLPNGAPGSPTKDGRGKNGSPVLRTREAFIAGGKISDLSELDERHSSSFDSKRDIMMDTTPMASVKEHHIPLSSSLSDKHHSCSSSIHGPEPSRASTFATYPSTPPSTPPAHKHTLTYLTTRQPSSMDAHSLLRGSCIRTLSCEQLPRTNSGPLFFGDDTTGYTISFVFRVPDSCARGRVRRYAFIAWAGREERRAARAYKEVLHVFAGMAGRIVDAVEKRESGMMNGSGCASAPMSTFLSSRSVDPDGFARKPEVRARGLVELVGKEDLFVEIHAAFVHLLAQLGRCLGGWPMGTPAIVDSGIRGEVGEEITVRGVTNSNGDGPSSNTDIQTSYDQVRKGKGKPDESDHPQQQKGKNMSPGKDFAIPSSTSSSSSSTSGSGARNGNGNGNVRGKRDIEVPNARASSPLERVSRRGIVV